MSWRTFRLRFLRRPVPCDGASLVRRALPVAAAEYAALLDVDSEILEDTDGPVVAPFRHLLPAALARRGLVLAQIPGGWRVERAPFGPRADWEPDADVTRVACRCGQVWWECACEAEIPLVPVEAWRGMYVAGTRGRPS